MSIRGILNAIRGGAKTSRFSKSVEVEVEVEVEYPVVVEEAFEPKEVKAKKEKVVKSKKEKTIKPTKTKES